MRFGGRMFYAPEAIYLKRVALSGRMLLKVDGSVDLVDERVSGG